MTHQELTEKLFANKKFKEAYKNPDIFMEIAFAIKNMRILHGLTQEALAKKAGLHQEAIARLENPGYSVKYLRNLEKIAKAFGAKLIAPKFQALPSKKRVTERISLNLKVGAGISPRN